MPPHPAPRRADIELNSLSLPQLFARFADTGLIDKLIALAADEDLGMVPELTLRGDPIHGPQLHSHPLGPEAPCGDITTDCCVPADKAATAHLVARKGGVIAGLACMEKLLATFTHSVYAKVLVQDGAHAQAGETVAALSGPLDELLTLERTLLNIVGRLSGVATQTKRYVDAIADAPRAKVYDTRKTTPGMRMLEKYAVRCGGGCCHRIGLYDAVLIKDNHLAGVSDGAIAEFVRDASARARELSRGHLSFIEVEVDRLSQFDALLALPKGTIDIVLLDNMNNAQLAEAAACRDAKAHWLELEASGGVTLETIGGIARTGVDRISVGALTHSVSSLDVALDVVVDVAETKE
jgi:nicotinate-nucleotide pyrophosphorylase (carboxylating)